MSGTKRSGEDSLSSAEEEDDKRRRNRRRPRALTDVSSIVAPAPLPGAVHVALEEKEHPMMKTIAELVAEHRHLDTSKTQSLMCETASSKLSSKSSSRVRAHDELKTVDHEKAADVDPWQNKLFLSKVATLPRVQYYFRNVQPTLSHDQLLTMLKQRQVQLPLLTAEYEQSIMGEAGLFEGSLVTYPACVNGAQCVTNTMNIPDPEGVGKFIGTALMYPEELQALKTTGTQPVSRRPCILCCRYHLADFVLTMRMMKMSNESDARSAAVDAAADTPQIHQLYRNLVDRPGGYYKEYMLVAREEEAILDPIVMFSCSPLRLVKYHGRRVVDQNTLVWRPPSTLNANVGEKVSNF